MATEKHSAWTVAAALLLIENDWKHYRWWLTPRVLETGLSDLQRRGGKTAYQTLRTAMMEKHADIFREQGRRSGEYRIRDDEVAMNDANVRWALYHVRNYYASKYDDLVGRSVGLGKWYNKRPTPNFCEDFQKQVRCLEDYERKLIRVRRLLIGDAANPLLSMPCVRPAS